MFTVELLVGGILSLLGGSLCGVLASLSDKKPFAPPIAAILLILWALAADNYLNNQWEGFITGMCFFSSLLVSGCVAGAKATVDDFKGAY